MGRYYAEAQGEDEAVAHACEDHYRPRGPDDLVPSDPVCIAVALADKIDTLVGFWAIGEKPTGSKDPYALRRAGLGVIRIIVDGQICLPLKPAFQKAVRKFTAGDDLLVFFADRLKVQLHDKGARHDLVDAVFALGGQDDLLLIVRRIEALGKFLNTDDGKICSPASNAPRTSCASRRRRTTRATAVRPTRNSSKTRKKRRWPTRSPSPKETPLPPSLRKILPPP